MLLFFDKVAYQVFLFSNSIHKNIFGGKNFRDDAKIHTVFVISLFQCLNLFLIILRYILIEFFDVGLSRYVSFAGLSLLLVFNYFRYYKKKTIDDLGKNEFLIFNNLSFTRFIVIGYFILSILVFLKIGDFARKITLLN